MLPDLSTIGGRKESKPSYCLLSGYDRVTSLRAQVRHALDFLTDTRDRLMHDHYEKYSLECDRISVLPRIKAHGRLIHRLENLYINGHDSSYIKSQVREIRKEFHYWWKVYPNDPQCPPATNDDDRLRIAFWMQPVKKVSLKESLEFLQDAAEHMDRDENPIFFRNMNKLQMMVDYCEQLKKSGANRRQAEFIHRVIVDRVGREDWFPVFNTLTVDGHHYQEVWGDRREHCKVWQRYIKQIQRAIASALGLKEGEYRASDIHRYAAVVENGTEHGRLHIHVLHLCKELPPGTIDPNYGRKVPNYKEISTFKAFWKYGFSSPRAVRCSDRDSYGMRGWRWPVERSGRDRRVLRPARLATVSSVAFYLGKYLAKGCNDRANTVKENKWHFRTKMTQGLGMTPYTSAVKDMSPSELRRVCMEPMISARLKVKGHRVSQTMLARAAMREYLTRMQKRSGKVWTILFGISPTTNIVKQYGQMLDMVLSPTSDVWDSVNIGSLVMHFMRNKVISDVELRRGYTLAENVQGILNDHFGPEEDRVVFYEGKRDVV